MSVRCGAEKCPICIHLICNHRNADPGKDVDIQRAVEHDQLILEFEMLTSDLDGLLGLLEYTLDSDDADFKAKRMLCTLFQVSVELSCS